MVLKISPGILKNKFQTKWDRRSNRKKFKVFPENGVNQASLNFPIAHYILNSSDKYYNMTHVIKI